MPELRNKRHINYHINSATSMLLKHLRDPNISKSILAYYPNAGSTIYPKNILINSEIELFFKKALIPPCKAL